MHILQSQWLRALTSNDVYFFELQLHRETHKDHNQFMQTHILGRLRPHDSDHDKLHKTHIKTATTTRRLSSSCHQCPSHILRMSPFLYLQLFHAPLCTFLHLPIPAQCLHTMHVHQLIRCRLSQVISHNHQCLDSFGGLYLTAAQCSGSSITESSLCLMYNHHILFCNNCWTVIYLTQMWIMRHLTLMLSDYI